MNDDYLVNQESRKKARPNYALHVGLFLATCITTTWAGVIHATGAEIGWLDFGTLLAQAHHGLPYSVSIMSILLAHEMGHYILARYHGVQASLPYFLPVPLPMVGTMGAVIVMRGGIPSRNALVDWAAAGPLAGLVIAIPVLAYGIYTSDLTVWTGGEMLEGNSIVYLSLKYLLKGLILPSNGLDIQLNLVAWAGWLGLLVTMINLMPIGQLDGGHIAYSYFGEKHNRFSSWLHRGTAFLALGVSSYVILDLKRSLSWKLAVAMGWGSGVPWLLWFGLLSLMKRFSGGQYHPPTGDEPLTPGRRRLCLFVMVIFLLILVPIPQRVAV